MKTLTTSVARILFAIPFLIFGVFHFMNAGQMGGMVPIPGGEFWVYLTGVAMIAAAISVFIGKLTKIAMLLLALLLLVHILTIHLPGAMEGNQQNITSLLKDFGLMAGALLVAGHYND